MEFLGSLAAGVLLGPVGVPWVKRAAKHKCFWAPLGTLVLGGSFRSFLAPLGRSSFQDVACFGLPSLRGLPWENVSSWSVLYFFTSENGPVTRSLLLGPLLAEAPVPLECPEVWKGARAGGGFTFPSHLASPLPSSPLVVPSSLPSLPHFSFPVELPAPRSAPFCVSVVFLRFRPSVGFKRLCWVRFLPSLGRWCLGRFYGCPLCANPAEERPHGASANAHRCGSLFF